MERKTLKEFHHQLSWSTRIYTLMTVATIVLGYFFDAWGTNWVMTMVLVLAVILFVETFAIFFHQHPILWKIIRWILLLMLLGIILAGFIGKGFM